jgi:hypothetical protein
MPRWTPSQPGKIVGGLCSRNLAGLLTGVRTTPEKRFCRH